MRWRLVATPLSLDVAKAYRDTLREYRGRFETAVAVDAPSEEEEYED